MAALPVGAMRSPVRLVELDAAVAGAETARQQLTQRVAVLRESLVVAQAQLDQAVTRNPRRGGQLVHHGLRPRRRARGSAVLRTPGSRRRAAGSRLSFAVRYRGENRSGCEHGAPALEDAGGEWSCRARWCLKALSAGPARVVAAVPVPSALAFLRELAQESVAGIRFKEGFCLPGCLTRRVSSC